MADEFLYDVAVTGGGLAGLTLAIQCASKGYKVVLFEKEQYPFHKVCGEYISMESRGFLERLGLPLQQWNLPIIKKLQTTDVAGRQYFFNLPLGGFGISRYKLDDELYRLVLEKKVKVITQCKVTDIKFTDDHFCIETTEGNYNATIATGCFGKRSNIDIKMNRSFIQQKANKLNNYIGIKYHINYPQPRNQISLHNFQNGYCGISNIENDTCCLCYLTTAENLKANSNSIKQMEQQVLWKNPHLKDIFSSADFIYNQPLAISQISFSRKTQVENHVLMMGDAAGMITPLCGNGMSMAMHAGTIAFILIDHFFEGKISREKMEQDYIANWQKHFSKRLWIGRKMQSVFGGNTSTSIFLKLMNALPVVANNLIASTHGEPF